MFLIDTTGSLFGQINETVTYCTSMILRFSSDLITSIVFADLDNGNKDMYNGVILGVPRRINDEVKERELIRKGLPYLI